MKVQILKQFRDKEHFDTIFKVGEVKNFDNDRATELIGRGLVKSLEEPAPEPQPEPQPETEKEEKPIEENKPNAKDKKGQKGKGRGKKSEQTIPGTDVPETEVPESAELGDAKEIEVADVNADGQPENGEQPDANQ